MADCNRSPTLSPRLDFPGFWPGTKTKWEVWLLRTWFDIAPVNKLVSLTWLLWALRRFRIFTLHYIESCEIDLIMTYWKLHSIFCPTTLHWKQFREHITLQLDSGSVEYATSVRETQFWLSDKMLKWHIGEKLTSFFTIIILYMYLTNIWPI